MDTKLALLLGVTVVLTYVQFTADAKDSPLHCDQHCEGGCSRYGAGRCDKRCVPGDRYKLDPISHRCVGRCRQRNRHCLSCKDHFRCEICKHNYKLVNKGKKNWKCIPFIYRSSSNATMAPPPSPIPITPEPTEEPLQTMWYTDVPDVTDMAPQTNEPPPTPPPMETDAPLPQTTAGPVAGPSSCAIVAQSYGNFGGTGACIPTPMMQQGSVTINGVTVYSMDLCKESDPQPGVRLLTVDPETCNVLQTDVYVTGTSSSDATLLANTLTDAATGVLFVAVTASEPHGQISQASAALRGVCGIDLTFLTDNGSFAFVCEVGFPEKTVYQVLPALSAPAAKAAATVTMSGSDITITKN